ncbi:MAG: hypothetical protein KC425_27935, partial [Anaerolineales bacterium]|nr:hypothetical protein [Anaerolineales bacterium]
MKQLTMILMIVMILAACSKEPPVPVGPELVWSVSLTTGGLASSIRPIIYQDKVIYSRNPLTPPSTLLAFNKHTGEKIWEWDDYIGSDGRLG